MFNVNENNSNELYLLFEHSLYEYSCIYNEAKVCSDKAKTIFMQQIFSYYIKHPPQIIKYNLNTQ